MEDSWLPMPRYKLRKSLVKRLLERESLLGKTCLEFGYGSGDMLLLFAYLGLEVFGFDISEAAVENAGSRIEKNAALKSKISLLPNKCDIHGRRYDYIMAFEILEHIEDDLGSLKEWRDILNENGKLLLSVPAHRGKWCGNDIVSGHYRRYEKADMKELLENAGFHVLHFWSYAYPLSILLDVFLGKRVCDESEENLTMEELSKQSGIKRKKEPFQPVGFKRFFPGSFFSHAEVVSR